jgi:hypothetical protein
MGGYRTVEAWRLISRLFYFDAKVMQEGTDHFISILDVAFSILVEKPLGSQPLIGMLQRRL